MTFLENKEGGKLATVASSKDNENRNNLRKLSEQFSGMVSDVEWTASNPFLFTNRQILSRLLYFNELYQLLLNKPGVICEFGVQYGATLALLSNLRGIYEPYNYTRKIIGFDTFSGFTGDLNKEEKQIGWESNDYSVPENYEFFLSELLAIHEKNAPIPHMNKFELVKGDVTETFEPWLEKNQHVVIGMAIFDMDVYAPTKYVLERILDIIPKGGVLVFDELNCDLFPGETQAVKETLGISNLRLHSNPNNPLQAWCVVE